MQIISLANTRRAFWFQVLGLGLLALGLALKAVDYLSDQIISTGYVTSKDALVKVLGWFTMLLVIFFGHAANDTHIENILLLTKILLPTKGLAGTAGLSGLLERVSDSSFSFSHWCSATS